MAPRVHGLIDAADWLTRALDVQGYRLDDVKGLSTDFLFPFLTSKSMAGKFAFGEFFDGNRPRRLSRSKRNCSR
jgi:alpha-amylase